ncbi:hypothetical protein NONI108955_01035 [Nocardia ninae]|uniref:hypothetical protein n=1 Tax=Nocardia ninae TaxID=356145 RepID=UPI0011BD8956|nr:hypothetical protein [Nocardia ninae]
MTALDIATLERIVKDVEGVSLHSNYRGRGMYDRACVGVEVLQRGMAMVAAFDIACALAERDGDGVDLEAIRDHLVELAGHECQDGMGLNIIVYWSNLVAIVD